MTHTNFQPSVELQALQQEMSSHPFWSNRLFDACRRGALTRDDFRHFFSQYYAYSRNFTRYLSGVMATCPDDYLRSRLSENLWEEGGGAQPEERHAEIFRRFLVDGLDIPEPKKLREEPYTRLFVGDFLASTRSEDHVYSASYLSLGTEAIVSRMYQLLVDGMLSAGLANDDLRFFHIHIGCDDEHAETLMMILEARRHESGWLERARRGMNDALEARRAFFEAAFDAIERRRYQPMIDRLSAREVLGPRDASPREFVSGLAEGTDRMYSNVNERLGVKFTVDRVRTPGAEVLDPRIVRIPQGWNNERHRHAHESMFFVVQGAGEVSIEDERTPMKAGDVVFVPRWAFHQSHNTGDGELVILAVTDFGLASKVLGDYDRTQRLRFGGVDAPEQTEKNEKAEKVTAHAPVTPSAAA